MHNSTCLLHTFSLSKGDFDGAIAQYILTIGKLEPSYVIRKVLVAIVTLTIVTLLSLAQFLDAQRIHNLTDYLKVRGQRYEEVCQ